MPHTNGGRDRALMQHEDHAARISDLNDQFRRTFVGGIVAATEGFSALRPDLNRSFLKAIQEFDDFTEDNDPYREHDFGAITLEGTPVFFKIDYYDCALIAGSTNPADPTKTLRVMTIMLASEY